MTKPKKPILVIGATVLYDYIFCVDHLPQPGKTARILPDNRKAYGQPLPGGTAFNIALSLAKFNEQVRITHPVGGDFVGSDYERSLRESGVSLDGLLINEQSASGIAYVFGASDGATVCFTSVTDLPQQHIPTSVLTGIDLIVLTPLMGPLHRQAGEHVQNKETSLAVCGMAEPEILTWLPQMFMLAINEYEMQLLSEFEDGLTPLKISRKMPGPLFITQGANGCHVYHRGEQLAHVTAIPPQQVIDTTGAGDAFFATALAGLRYGFDPVDAARMGVAAGSMVVEVVGCQANLPNWSTLAGRVSEQYPELATKLKKVRII